MSGHIRRRGARSWELKFEIANDGSDRETQYRSFKGTKADAQRELTRLTASAINGTYVDPSKITVTEFLARWLKDWAAANTSPKTLQRYVQNVRYINSNIGELQLQRLRPAQLSELYATLLREGGRNGRKLSARSVGNVHRLLHAALTHAVAWGLILQNPSDSVSPPRSEAVEIEILRDGEAKELLDRLRGTPLYMIAVLGLATGMRRGEMLALRWSDIQDGKIQVERSLEQSKLGGLRFKMPKTKAGKRSISIPPSIVAELRRHRLTQQERWLALGLGRISDATLVFTTWDGKPQKPDTVSKDWCLNVGVVTLHALRHTHASQLIAAGMDVISVSRRLGHAKASITLNTYGHLFANTDDRAADIVEAAFSQMTEHS
jgi:integrase